ncbi:hypothetical protein PISMIDRAFT_72101, partial [Pisolithus microcarpus 441]
VRSVAFVDDVQVVAGYDNGDIRRWNIEDGRQQGPTMQTGVRVLSIAGSQDGRWIVSGDNGNKATVWNALTSEKVRHTEHGNTVGAVDISSDCTKVVAANYGSTTDNVRLFDINSGTQLLPSLSHFCIFGVKFSPDGTSNGKFIACSAGSSVSLWDCMSHRQIGPIIIHTVGIRCIALSPSGGYLACG